jgi:hypothetical protein
MPGKRSKRRDTGRFTCPDCETRLWRIGSEKHQIYCSEASDFVHYIGLTRRQAVIEMAQGCRTGRRSWIEEFFCGKHGKMWLLVRNLECGKIITTAATVHDWKRANGTQNPDCSNPSVGEFTQRMSRPPQIE